MKQDPSSVSRRRFLEVAGGTALLGGLYGLTFLNDGSLAKPRSRPPARPDDTDLVVVEGTPNDYAAITERAVEEFGGIEKFVRKGDHVVLSPNMGWMRTPEQA